MNPEKQRISIAEFCGFKWSTPHYGHDGIWHSTPYTGDDIWTEEFSAWAGKPHDVLREVNQLHDFLNDLNAMHDAESRLTESQQEDFMESLHCVTGPLYKLRKLRTTEGYEWTACHSTAAQRAEALLRTISKWQDDTALKTEAGS